MSEFLLEILSEEIPARMQKNAADQLAKIFTDKLKEQNIEHGAVTAFSTPMRLGVVVEGLPEKVEDRMEEHRGPKVDAPEKAIEGFLNSKGITLESCKQQETPKGSYWIYEEKIPGKAMEEVLRAISEEMFLAFDWPKSMRWSNYSLRWVRPINSVLALFDGKQVPVKVPNTDGNIVASDMTRGHRFIAPTGIEVSSFKDYKEKLLNAGVMIDREERKAEIVKQSGALASSEKLTVREDEGLLEELAGLVEYPYTVIGSFDEDFLTVPDEALIASMRGHQKYLSLLNKDGSLSNKFIVVTNVPSDEKRTPNVASGNEKVLRARLSDAKFFWDQDLKTPLENNLSSLEDIVFHAKLGSVKQKAERLALLSEAIASTISADTKDAKRAAELCKADLVSQMVYEFPELQGIMGMYYAKAQNENEAVAQAINDHYKPVGASDDVPTEKVSIAVALADKVDTIAGFFAIDEKPTGSKDPYALRRAALGIIRIILQNKLSLSLEELFGKALQNYQGQNISEVKTANATDLNILEFVADRMKFALKAEGISPDLIAAVFASLQSGQTLNLPEWQERIYSLQKFLETDDGANLLAGYKRAANIVRIEQKKSKQDFCGDIEEALLTQKEEEKLFSTLQDVQSQLPSMLEKDDYPSALKTMSKLRKPIDTFFDKIVVNDNEEKVRENRLKLLKRIEQTVNQVADLSLVR